MVETTKGAAATSGTKEGGKEGGKEDEEPAPAYVVSYEGPTTKAGLKEGEHGTWGGRKGGRGGCDGVCGWIFV